MYASALGQRRNASGTPGPYGGFVLAVFCGDRSEKRDAARSVLSQQDLPAAALGSAGS
jgi:hypothetical protein